ncbi:MAG: glycosyltransferase family 2 protein [Myxococcales bacterium]|nr:glycosyltransferase family 2 protein [Myxococcales bacterium]MCB9702834.1 glycosyltransferase family 2 protein [Myxococcales bacterium]
MADLVAEPAGAPSVTVLLPAHNEAPSIAAVIAGVMRSTPGLREVLVIDDGSRDQTAALAEAAGARVIRLPENRGKGAAVRVGVREAEGEVIVLLDADGQDDPAEIPLLLDALADDVDLVVGSRFLGTFEAGAITPIDRLGNLALTGLFNVATRSRVTDTQAGFRAIRRETLAALELRADRYDIETDMLVALLGRGGRVVEVAVTRRARSHGHTDLDRIRDGLRILGRIIGARWRSRTPLPRGRGAR